MKKKINAIKKVILPNKTINIIAFNLIILGVIAGTIFILNIGKQDQKLALEQVTNFFENIEKNNINSGLALKNSIITNFTYISAIFILGLSIIGLPIVIFLLFFKGFLVGFSVSAIILNYSYKGAFLSFLYLFPGTIINIIALIILSIYSTNFSYKLVKSIFSKEKINTKLALKQYIIIYLFTLIAILISSLLEIYLFPNLTKLVTNIFN